jgi:hypothetical protein
MQSVAADLARLTGLELGTFILDDHLHWPIDPETDRGPRLASVITQAIGVPIGRGG